MSMLRLVSRIVPTCCEDKSISHLLVARDIDTPVRTDISCSGDRDSTNFVVYETTFCKERPLDPPCADPDAALAARCDATPGLVNLRKSRLRLATETVPPPPEEGGPADPVIRVSPENAGDGTCGGILVSIPLRLSRREVRDASGASTFYFSAGHVEQQGVSDAEGSNAEQNAGNIYAHECEPCGKSFSTPALLQEHRSAKHCGVRSFSCERCGRRFAGRRKLVLHLETHEQRDGHRCPFCGARCEGRRALRQHVDTHAGDLPHLCAVCPSRFATALDLRNHAVRHKRRRRPGGKGRSFACAVCGKAFALASSLAKHRRTHGATDAPDAAD